MKDSRGKKAKRRIGAENKKDKQTHREIKAHNYTHIYCIYTHTGWQNITLWHLDYPAGIW